MTSLLLVHLRRSWRLGLFAAVVAFAFQMIVVRIFQTMMTGPQAAQAGLFGRLMPKWIQTAMGLEEPLNSLSGFLTVIYQHPFLLALFFALPLATASAFLAGEVERRTLALLLSRPVSRLQITMSACLVSAFWPLLAALAAWGGTMAGIAYTGVTPAPAPDRLAWVAMNLYMLSLAGAGLALAFSALSSERSDAMGWSITILLGMYVLHFLAQIWRPAAQAADWLLFHYYSPARILVGGVIPAFNLQVLALIAVVGSVVALVAFSRRNFSV